MKRAQSELDLDEFMRIVDAPAPDPDAYGAQQPSAPPPGEPPEGFDWEPANDPLPSDPLQAASLPAGTGKPKRATRPAKTSSKERYTFADWQAGLLPPKGWDVADALEAGWSIQQFYSMSRKYVRKWPYEETPRAEPEQSEPEPPAAEPPDMGPEPPPHTEPPHGAAEADAGLDLVEVTPRRDKPRKASIQSAGALHLPPLGHPEFSETKADAWKERRGIVGYDGGDPAALLEWVFLDGDGRFFSKRTGAAMTKMSFDLSMKRFAPGIQFFGDAGKDKDGNPKPKRFPASETLVSYLPGGASVRGTMYRPDVPDPVFEHRGELWANSYLAHMVPVIDPKWRDHDAWKIVRDHIHDIFPDGAEIIIKWMAHNVQHPGVKIRWSPILVGVEGDGKTTLAKKCLQAAMGGNVKDVSPEEIFSEFSAWAEGACVRVMEEIRIRGENRASAMDKLKPKISNDAVSIVRKGMDGYEIANVTNYIACTNHMDALAITPGDRRYGVFKTRFESRKAMRLEKTDPEWRAYWHRLHDAVDNHPGVVRGWLLDVDLSDFDRNDAPPETDAKLAMIKAALSSDAMDVQEAIELGGAGIGPNVVSTNLLRLRMKEIAGSALNTRRLSKALSDLGMVKFGRVKWVGETHTVYYRKDAFPGDGIDAALLRRFLDVPGLDPFDPEPF